jgi:hypothetical protein
LGGEILGADNVRVNCPSPGGFFNKSSRRRSSKPIPKRTQLGRMANDTDLKGRRLPCPGCFALRHRHQYL